VILSNHSIYMIFLDPHQGIDDLTSFWLLLKVYVELR
jgi:hypothetical protein